MPPKNANAPEPPPAEVCQAVDDVVDRVLLLLCAGVSRPAMAKAATEGKLGIDPEALPAAIDAARARLTLAIDYNRDEEIGRAITRLNDIYARALKVQDTKTALSAERERIRMMNLDAAARHGELAADKADMPADDGPDGPHAPTRPHDEAAEVLFAAVDEYIEPHLPPDDHATYADRIRQAGAMLAPTVTGSPKPVAGKKKPAKKKPATKVHPTRRAKKTPATEGRKL